MENYLLFSTRVAQGYQMATGDGQLIPSRCVLLKAIETNQRLGHENRGFLSEKNGFMPINLPLQALPSSHRIWDDIASELPELCRKLNLRQRLNAMPLLPADANSLSDVMLLRASSIISAFAHTYYYIDTEPPSALPPSILKPWQEIAQRLHRKEAHMSYIDMSTYNWRLIDPNGPMEVENLRLLIPYWGNEEERIFLGSTIEIQAQSTPLVGAIVRAQEAVTNDNPQELEKELLVMLDCLNHLTFVCLPKVIPNSRSRLFVDPVVWAKTIAPLSVPIRQGAAGPVGAATASLQALDAFLERGSYASDVGQESIHVREWFPPHWADFFLAVKAISVSNYIRQNNIPRLNRIFQDVLYAYAGENGFLGRHRLKAAGYIQTAFKSGRSATAAFKGSFKDRIWENIDKQLELARQERYHCFSKQNNYHQAFIKEVKSVSELGNVVQVKLGLEESCVYYRPGDRCAVLPENQDILVEKTLKALQATGDELIPLDPTWQVAINYRHGYQGYQSLPLRTLLKFGQIRPIKRPVAKLLFTLTHHPTLRRIIQNHVEQEWELWDLLEMLIADGFDPKRLLGVEPDAVKHICQVVPPEYFRLYSISSVMTTPVGSSLTKGATELELTIGKLHYETQDNELSRQARRSGTASQFLARENQNKIAIRIVPSPSFHLPQDVNRPIVMFAGGTGISPCRSFLLERATAGKTGENWLFFSTPTRRDFHYQPELTDLIAAGKLHLRMVFTREDIQATFQSHGDENSWQFTPRNRHRIGDEIQQEENKQLLWKLLQGIKEGGKGAYIYVCGQTGFATSVREALEQVIAGFCEGYPQEKQRLAAEMIENLMADGRYLEETFTPFVGALEETVPLYDLSEIALHNNEDEGYWLIINDAVYDVTPFRNQHPGGFKILRSYSGMDATVAYHKVGHHADQEIQAMLASYRIGIVRGFANFQAATPIDNFYRSWVSYLFLIVEIENALSNDFSIQREIVTQDEVQNGISVSPVKLMMYIKTHQRFLLEFLPQIFGEVWEQVLQMTEEIYREDFTELREAFSKLQETETSQKVLAVYPQFITKLKTAVGNHTISTDEVILNLGEFCAHLEQADSDLLRKLKLTVCKIIQLFEQFGDDVMTLEVSTEIRQIARQFPDMMLHYYERVAALAESP
jgi:sulfite reductase (NADPH) flavoprotein alpha-component